MHPSENNRELYILIDTRNSRAFEASAFWAMAYAAEQGYRSGSVADPTGCHGSLISGLFIVPTGRSSTQDVSDALDFHMTVDTYQIFA